MERLLTLQDIKDRYKLRDDKTARRRMKEMGALNIRPIMVPESAVMSWEAANRAKKPGEEDEMRSIRKKNAAKQLKQMFNVTPVQPKPGQYISRVRPKEERACGT